MEAHTYEGRSVPALHLYVASNYVVLGLTFVIVLGFLLITSFYIQAQIISIWTLYLVASEIDDTNCQNKL